MSNRNEHFERQKEMIQQLNVMDDEFFAKVAEDLSAVEEILQVLLQDDALHLRWTKTQVHLRNCGTRSVILDALCESVEGKLYSIEMEKSNRDDHQRRVRYNGSNIDTSFTEKGVDFKEIPDICMIYISKSDFFKEGFCMYHVERTVKENGREVNNGWEEIYVNARIDDGSKIAELMKYMKDTRGENFLFPKLSARVKYLKEQREGVHMVSKALAEYTEEKVKEAKKEAKREAKQSARNSAINLFQNGVNFEVVAQSITQLTRGELERLYQKTVMKA